MTTKAEKLKLIREARRDWVTADEGREPDIDDRVLELKAKMKLLLGLVEELIEAAP